MSGDPRHPGMATRRMVLAAMGACLAAPSSGRQQGPFFRAHRLPIGLQLYTVGEQATARPEATLRAVRTIGYETVELAGFLGLEPQQLREVLDAAGLTCTSAHIQSRRLRPGPSLRDDPGTLAQQARIIGFDTVVMPLFDVPERFSLIPRSGETIATMIARIGNDMTLSDWSATAEFLNITGAALKAEGLKLSYHNHNNEFAPSTRGRDHMEMLLASTDPALVSFELDVGWAVAAGRDPSKLLSDHPHRFTAMHVKDLSATTRPNFILQQDPAEVGSGIIDWKSLLPAAYRSGIRRFFVEQERPFDRPPLEAVKTSFDYLATLKA